MKRDMDLVRDILLKVEKADRALTSDDMHKLKQNDSLIDYHVELLTQHKLLDADITHDWNNDIVGLNIAGLTWEGRDFLEGMRNPTLWEKVKSTLKESGAFASFEVIKFACIEVAKASIKATLQ